MVCLSTSSARDNNVFPHPQTPLSPLVYTIRSPRMLFSPYLVPVSPPPPLSLYSLFHVSYFNHLAEILFTFLNAKSQKGGGGRRSKD